MNSIYHIVRQARREGWTVPGFNIPYLPMMRPIVRALRNCNSFGLIMVARLEWMKFQAGSIEAVRDEYARTGDPRHTRLHLDHVPVIDEDRQQVDYLADIRRAIQAGYHSVMLDASRLPLAENIACTKQVVALAHAAGVAVEAELGSIMGHEDGPLPPYNELFESGQGFTDPDEARQFVQETGVDWLSVAVGSIHGAINATRNQPKVAARLNIDWLKQLNAAADIPLVLHGGTGIPKGYIMDAIRNGIAKINIATAIRRPYETNLPTSPKRAAEAVYEATCKIIREELETTGTAEKAAAAQPEK
ncbi:MAG: class II fructose-bisphosphate aldolase [Kiritimatiellia bacterium]|jgi:ketose-bisphosphate aldolase